MDEEILNALKKIKAICKKTNECSKCPFGNCDDDCFIGEYRPSDWNLRDTEICRYFE